MRVTCRPQITIKEFEELVNKYTKIASPNDDIRIKNKHMIEFYCHNIKAPIEIIDPNDKYEIKIEYHSNHDIYYYGTIQHKRRIK